MGNEASTPSPSAPPPAANEWHTTIIQDGNAAEEAAQGGTMLLNSRDVELARDDSIKQLIGVQFTDVQVPRSSHIAGARVVFVLAAVVDPI
eukprot:5299586-Prymnesium_polylepis.1